MFTIKVAVDSDVRRVRVPKDASFDKALEEVTKAFQGCDEFKGRVLRYKDEEGDLCTLVPQTWHDAVEVAGTNPSNILHVTAIADAEIKKREKKLDKQEKKQEKHERKEMKKQQQAAGQTARTSSHRPYKINLTVRGFASTVDFAMRLDAPFENVLQKYCDRVKVSPAHAELLWDTKVVPLKSTPESFKWTDETGPFILDARMKTPPSSTSAAAPATAGAAVPSTLFEKKKETPKATSTTAPTPPPPTQQPQVHPAAAASTAASGSASAPPPPPPSASGPVPPPPPPPPPLPFDFDGLFFLPFFANGVTAQATEFLTQILTAKRQEIQAKLSEKKTEVESFLNQAIDKYRNAFVSFHALLVDRDPSLPLSPYISALQEILTTTERPIPLLTVDFVNAILDAWLRETEEFRQQVITTITRDILPSLQQSMGMPPGSQGDVTVEMDVGPDGVRTRVTPGAPGDAAAAAAAAAEAEDEDDEGASDDEQDNTNQNTTRETNTDAKQQQQQQQQQHRHGVYFEGRYEVHENVQCDGCGAAPIRGPRFKCITCDDFDFCRDCKKKWKKDEIQHPVGHRFRRQPIFFGGMGMPRGGGCGRGGRGHRGRGAGFFGGGHGHGPVGFFPPGWFNHMMSQVGQHVGPHFPRGFPFPPPPPEGPPPAPTADGVPPPHRHGCRGRAAWGPGPFMAAASGRGGCMWTGPGGSFFCSQQPPNPTTTAEGEQTGESAEPKKTATDKAGAGAESTTPTVSVKQQQQQTEQADSQQQKDPKAKEANAAAAAVDLLEVQTDRSEVASASVSVYERPPPPAVVVSHPQPQQQQEQKEKERENPAEDELDADAPESLRSVLAAAIGQDSPREEQPVNPTTDNVNTQTNTITQQTPSAVATGAEADGYEYVQATTEQQPTGPVHFPSLEEALETGSGFNIVGRYPVPPSPPLPVNPAPSAAAAPASLPPPPAPHPISIEQERFEEALRFLVGAGFQREEARKALEAAKGNQADAVEILLRH